LLVSTIADPSHFTSARQFAAWIGLVPRQYSSGCKERLGSISKRGNPYLRRLLVIGAHSVLRWGRARLVKASRWLQGLLARRPLNVVATALAHKMARTVWAVMTKKEAYRTPKIVATA
jgi:transposase